MKLFVIGLAASLTLTSNIALSQSSDTEWPTYGHDAGGQRYSPLKQITPANVNQLQQAWAYHMKVTPPASAAAAVPSKAEAAQSSAEGFPAGPPGPGGAPANNAARFRNRVAGSETTPLVINGLMYISTSYKRVVALDAESGKEVWIYEVPGGSQASLRGVEYWAGDKTTPARIIFGTRDGQLIALDALNGAPVAAFGDKGIVNLRTPEVLNGFPDASLGMTSPPLVFDNLIITGSAVQEGPSLGASGAVRAWDIHSGKLAWTFNSIPAKGTAGANTWAGNSAKGRSGVNSWGFQTVDVQRGILYIPLGAPSWDRYGGDRLGNNLFSTSLVAVNARTGKYLWHFQLVHHDIWDYDAAAPPALIDVTQNGKTIPAVAVVNKNGLLFLLNRVSGKPIYKVEERPVPKSDVPGEVASPTQPFPVKPPPLARNSFSMEDVAKVTPELQAYCENFIKSNNMIFGSPYIAFGNNKSTILFPGFQGGANWGGTSFDPTQHYLFVNTLDMGQVFSLTKADEGAALPYKGGAVNSRFSQDSTRLMCQEPPWGRLTAVNVNTGEIAWQSVLGISDNLPPEKQKTGRPNVGGSIATAGGLVFIGATDDSRFRAFDSRTGAELWTAKLDASAHATPMTYAGKSGKQYVAIVATGGSFLNSPIVGDAVVVFALPEAKK